ncbi:MAG TPA: hypothetical protein VN915_02720 [Elusimicrobiota bacterium]|nr:hypothetical protein [Elusimicrobiota bacterium]
MRALALVALLAAAAAAVPQLVPVNPKRKKKAPPPPAPQLLGAHTGAPYWFKTYSTAPYLEIWTGALALKNFSKDVPSVVKAVEAHGGALTQPIGNFVANSKDQTQQLTFSLPKDHAADLLKDLRKLGDMPDPMIRTMGAPIPLAEVRSKIAVMMKEKTDHAAELAKVPAAAGAEEEILEHLLMVEEVGARASAQVRFNLSVSQK